MTERVDLSNINIDESVENMRRLFAELAIKTRGQAGISREPYGPGEQLAHDMVADQAQTWGLQTRVDEIGNLYMTLPGKDRTRPAWYVGSHLDSVPEGGNYDGAAGVLAGLAVAHALVAQAVQLPMDLTVIAMRAEEASSWFSGKHRSHFGSRAMFGQLPYNEMKAAARRLDGQTLEDRIRLAGFSPASVGSGINLVDPSTVAGFIELHIEQGPVLIEAELSVALITGIRGNIRARSSQVIGEHAHSGAVPREHRKDAVFAVTEFAYKLEQQWHEWLELGRDCVCTIGILSTDPQQHALSKVPGLVSFVIDFRSVDGGLLDEATRFISELAREIEQRRAVKIELGSIDRTNPVTLDRTMLEEFSLTADQINMRTIQMASGGGHDAVSFHEAGIPTAMLFVRNQNGSHNPNEAMEISDFREGVQLILAFLLNQK